MHLRPLSVALLLAAAVQGQCPPAQYSFYGQGCAGTGSGTQPCASANWLNPFAGNIGARANFALPVAGPVNPMVICSVDLFTATRTGQPATTNFWIYDRPVPGGPPGTAIGTTTINVPGTPGVCTATFTTPVIILPGADFFLVLDNRVDLQLPIASSGNVVTHYWNGPPTWNGPFNSVRWIYQINCCVGSGAVPALTNTGVPQLGGTYNVDLFNSAPSALAILFTGSSNTSWLGIPLPLDLTPAGAPGCMLLASGTLFTTVVANGNGAGTQPLGLPNDPSLCGARLYQQWMVLDPGANMLGFAASNGGVATLGS
jgi:hypothetical protein